MKQVNHHFFAANAVQWKRSNDEVSLVDLVKEFGSYKKPFNLFYVPLPWDSEYKVDNYAPQVKGIIQLVNIYDF